MINRPEVAYITIDWQKQAGSDIIIQDGSQETLRQVCTLEDYPENLPCRNPNCSGGGFEIGHRIKALIESEADSEQNSLVCRNAVHNDRAKRCFNTIIYSIVHVRPYQGNELL